ncbi:MAG TPA: hypothetical protein VKT22_04400 [Steroidobacteraceae bacterium]|jgi:hypothetical protein|nr:hypothetical protein [Steroidobacteraceae bacterium]
MKLSDDRLEEIRAWASGERTQDPSMQPQELAAIVNELKQLRLRVLSKSRSAPAYSAATGH